MELATTRSKRLDAWFADESHEIPDKKVRVTLAGQVKTLRVFKVPLDHLIFNIRNGRFAAELLQKEEEPKRKLDATVQTDAEVIKQLLLDQDKRPMRLEKTASTWTNRAWDNHVRWGHY